MDSSMCSFKDIIVKANSPAARHTIQIAQAATSLMDTIDTQLYNILEYKRHWEDDGRE